MKRIEELIDSIVEKIYNGYSKEIKEFEKNNSVDIKKDLFEAGKIAVAKIEEKNKSNSSYDITKDDKLTWFLRKAMVKKLSDLEIIKK